MDKVKKQYTTDVLRRPGMTFAVDIADPKERVQAYLDSYKGEPKHEVRSTSFNLKTGSNVR